MPKADPEYKIHVNRCLRSCSKRRQWKAIIIEIEGRPFNSSTYDTMSQMTNPISKSMSSEEY